jgi:hypothetical protein
MMRGTHPQVAPFFILEEVAAALDNINMTKVENYICAHTSDEFQFIVVSLKGSLNEKGNSPVGIYPDQDVNSSRTLTLDASTVISSSVASLRGENINGEVSFTCEGQEMKQRTFYGRGQERKQNSTTHSQGNKIEANEDNVAGDSGKTEICTL